MDNSAILIVNSILIVSICMGKSIQMKRDKGIHCTCICQWTGLCLIKTNTFQDMGYLPDKTYGNDGGISSLATMKKIKGK